MSDADNSAEDRSHAPTQQRLQRARKDGEVVYSTEITAAATYAAFYVAIIAAGGWSSMRIGAALTSFLGRPQDLGEALFAAEATQFALSLTLQLFIAAAPVFGALALGAILSLVAQRAVVFAPKKLKPKLSRLSIIDNAKQKYGPSGLFEFFKSFAKLSAVISILVFALKDRFLNLPELAGLPTQAFSMIVFRETVYFVGLVTMAAVLVAALDFPWKRYEHEKRLRMSFEELKRESKENEGDPAMKGKRRERANEIARNRMLADVPGANVVIVNPTHYAVALKWDRHEGGAPVCVAKGVDEVAARIREIAAEAGVPIRRDPPTARSIYSMVEVGDEIKREHYAAVAAAIHYAQEIERKSKMKFGL